MVWLTICNCPRRPTDKSVNKYMARYDFRRWAKLNTVKQSIKEHSYFLFWLYEEYNVNWILIKRLNNSILLFSNRWLYNLLKMCQRLRLVFSVRCLWYFYKIVALKTDRIKNNWVLYIETIVYRLFLFWILNRHFDLFNCVLRQINDIFHLSWDLWNLIFFSSAFP